MILKNRNKFKLRENYKTIIIRFSDFQKKNETSIHKKFK